MPFKVRYIVTFPNTPELPTIGIFEIPQEAEEYIQQHGLGKIARVEHISVTRGLPDETGITYSLIKEHENQLRGTTDNIVTALNMLRNYATNHVIVAELDAEL